MLHFWRNSDELRPLDGTQVTANWAGERPARHHIPLSSGDMHSRFLPFLSSAVERPISCAGAVLCGRLPHIETLPGTLCATSNPPPRAPRRQRVRSGDDASSSAPTVRFPVEVASALTSEHVLPATTPSAHACNVSAESCIGSDVVIAALRDDADSAFAVAGVDASAAVLRRPRNASFSSRMRQNLWAA